MFKLYEVAEIYTGLPIRDSQDGGARFLRLSDMSSLMKGETPMLARGDVAEVARATSVQAGDLIVAARGAETDICEADAQIAGAFISLDLYLVRPDAHRIDPFYLKTILQLPGAQAKLAAQKQGTALTRIPKEALAQLEIPLPSIQAQEHVSALAKLADSEQRLLQQLMHCKSIYHREILGRAMKSAMLRHN